MLFPVPHNYNKILILQTFEQFFKMIKICPKRMGSFDQTVHKPPFFIFLNESTIYLKENELFIQNSNGCIFLFCPGCQNKLPKLRDRKMNRAQFLNLFWKALTWVSNPCKFYTDMIIFDLSVALFLFCLNLTPKMIFDPCDPPGESGSKIFYPDIPLVVTHHLSPK